MLARTAVRANHGRSVMRANHGHTVYTQQKTSIK
jgi:hypothetical protein